MQDRTMRTGAFFAAIGLFACGQAAGQEFRITEPFISACQGAFLDSGGNPSNYGNNESFTSTICPDGTGPAISLQWIVFNLSGNGNAPLDQISIYDGPSTSDPLIGTWNGTNSPGIISASFANVNGTGGGCLTVVFTSNNTGTGNFAASISCFAPCEPPTAVATFGSAVPLLACQNETITFDASTSFAAAGFTVAEYNWDFADGATATGAVVQHAFAEPGEYVVQVEVVDDNGCVSTNLVDLQVLVSTTPLFTGTTPSTTVCQGESVVLGASPTPVTWSALPETNLGGGIFLPDLQGVPFSTGVQFTSFAPGQTLTTPLDLQSICVSMEHSYMGDLVIALACPNGQSVTLHQQGGGSTYLGVPVDDEGDPDAQGTCWNYCWSPTATNGTWAENAGGTLPAGTYESVQPFSNLVGCPLNGTWTLTVTDLFAIDNGFLCDWSLTFPPSLFPSLTTFTPDLGTSTLDSTQWTGPNVLTDPNSPLVAVVNTPDAGVFNYVYSVTDNFGCTYDTTIAITVNPSPQGPIEITGDSLICEDGVAYLSVPEGFDSYSWSPVSGTASNVNVDDPGNYTVTVAFGNCPYTTDPFTVAVAPNPVPVIVGPPVQCGDDPSVLSTQDPYASYLWSNNTQGSTASVGAGSWFVIVTDTNGCNGTSAPFVLEPVPVPVITGLDLYCPGDSVQLSTDGTPYTSVQWSDGTAGSTAFVTEGSYTVSGTVATCTVTSDPFVVVEIDLPELAITGPALYCENGSTTLNASAGYDAYIWSNGVPGTSATVEEGVYTVTAVLGACSATSDPFAVTEAPNPQPVIVGPPVQCGDALAELSTQLPYVTYLWSDNTQGSTTTVGAGPWTVTVTDANGCSGTSSPFVVINAPFPVAGFTVDPPSPAPVETTVDFTNTSTVSGGVISSWQWNFGILGQTSSEPSPSFTYTGPGDYLVTLVVTTAAGCSDTTSQLYVVFPPDLRIPNVFTPNGDNVNDTYSIENLRYYGHELRIYSRWGTLVHESSDASREWRASEQPDGTYYYVLTLQDGRELAGHITVLR